MTAPADRPTHLRLPERKALIGRFLAFDVYEAHQSSDVSNRLAAIRTQILAIANQELEAGDDTHLDAWLKKVAGLVDAGLASHSTKRPTAAMRRMAQDFRRRCAALSCRGCAGKTAENRICNGSLSDSKTVDHAGDCIRPFKDLFAASHQIAQAYYRKFAGDGLKPLNLEFSTALAPADKKMLPGYAVLGDTGFHDSRNSAVSNVRLFLQVRDFDWPTYQATLYVLLHECVCHAFVALGANATRPALMQYDSFAEGWMDYVVDLILDDLKANAGPAAAAGKLLPHLSLYDEGQRYHHDRVNPKIAAAVLQQGVNAARATYDVLQDIPAVADARETMFQLSFQLNSLSFSDFSIEARLDLTRNLARYLDRKVPKYHPKKTKITGILRRFALENDIRASCAELNSL